ncbi:MAG: glucosaminidase domain-containing protein [Labilibaculum sp.]|nr:glucosaminidase domain-containing protein [Labilibaculum sp.]MBI9058732.1 glucosaminidase domain-containing protein [Labilibaculum sp.]
MRSIFILILGLTTLLVSCEKPITYKESSVLSQYATINQKEDIFSFTDTCITPYVYTKVISLRDLPVIEKKQKFVEMLLPSILVAKHDLFEKIKRVEHIQLWQETNPILLEKDSLFLSDLFETYKCNELPVLKRRLKPHPASIVLGQAALESGWGSSRFFKEGNNVFGIWSYHAGENRIKALVGRDSTSIYVRSYESIENSVEDYFKTIARVNAYKEFRIERYNCEEPLKLVSFLSRYSEVGEIYTNKLKQLIESNDLTKYDTYVIKEEFLLEKEILLSEAI